MKKLLITGFEPFGGEEINPSWEIVSRLPNEINGYMLTKLRIPVVFGEAAEAVLAKAAEISPDVILCIGQAGGRSAITPELVAINLRYAKIPDNKGNQPKDEPISQEGPCAHFSTLPARQMAEAISAAGVASQLSYSAGAYVCNDLLYTLLHRYQDTPTRVGFVHVPYSTEQGKEPAMEMEDMIKGLTASIENMEKEHFPSKYNLRNGMLLYCKDGQTVQLASFSDTHIRVVYKGKIVERPISVINEKLFFSEDCEIAIPEDFQKTKSPILDEQRSDSIVEKEKSITEDTASSTHKTSTVDNASLAYAFPVAEDISLTNKKEETWVKSCRNCRFQSSGECSSWDLCDDYQPIYVPPKSETDYYPKYGDATMFKRKSKKR